MEKLITVSRINKATIKKTPHILRITFYTDYKPSPYEFRDILFANSFLHRANTIYGYPTMSDEQTWQTYVKLSKSPACAIFYIKNSKRTELDSRSTPFISPKTLLARLIVFHGFQLKTKIIK